MIRTGYNNVNESKNGSNGKDVDISKINSLIKNIGDFGSDFPRSMERFAYELKHDIKIEIDEFRIKAAKDYLDKYSKLYIELAKIISSAEEGNYLTRSGEFINESVNINESSNDSKDIDNLKKMLKREKEIEKIIAKNGFEGAMKYKDEYHKLLSDIGILASKIDGKGAIHGKGIIAQLSESLDMNESYSNEKQAIYNWFLNHNKNTPKVNKVLSKFKIRYIDDIDSMTNSEAMELWDALYDVLYDEQGIDLMNESLDINDIRNSFNLGKLIKSDSNSIIYELIDELDTNTMKKKLKRLGCGKVIVTSKGLGFSDEINAYSGSNPRNSEFIIHTYSGKNDNERYLEIIKLKMNESVNMNESLKIDSESDDGPFYLVKYFSYRWARYFIKLVKASSDDKAISIVESDEDSRVVSSYYRVKNPKFTPVKRRNTNESVDMNESLSSTYSIQDLIDDGTWVPGEDDDEIDTCKLYMKELKCQSLEELLSVTEDDDNVNYDKLVKLTEGIKGKRVKGAPQDIASEIITLSDGTKVIFEGVYGYYSYYFSKKDTNKLEKCPKNFLWTLFLWVGLIYF